MTTQWAQPGAEHCAWLMYSANYLLRTAGVRWAIDPVRLEHRLPGAPSVDYTGGLSALSFVVLTHRHSDHLDIPLIRSLAHLPIAWVVPAQIRKRVINEGGIPGSSVIVPKHLRPIEVNGIRLIPFKGRHWEKESGAEGERLRGVPAMAYLVEFGGDRWLFPGDTRTYDARLLPTFGPVDGLFAHVWLGRACASQSKPALLDPFCRFLLDLHPRRIVLTHLQEFVRSSEDYWDVRHARLVRSRLHEMCPEVEPEVALMGDRVLL